MKTKTVLTIRELAVDAKIGFYPEEKAGKQKLVMNVSFEVAEPKKDDVSGTVNYAELAGEIYEKVRSSEFNLLETLGRFVMDIIMKRPLVKSAEVEIIKPDAPLPHTKGSSVKVTAER